MIFFILLIVWGFRFSLSLLCRMEWHWCHPKGLCGARLRAVRRLEKYLGKRGLAGEGGRPANPDHPRVKTGRGKEEMRCSGSLPLPSSLRCCRPFGGFARPCAFPRRLPAIPPFNAFPLLSRPPLQCLYFAPAGVTPAVPDARPTPRRSMEWIPNLAAGESCFRRKLPCSASSNLGSATSEC